MKLSMQIQSFSADKEPCVQTSVTRIYFKAQRGQMATFCTSETKYRSVYARVGEVFSADCARVHAFISVLHNTSKQVGNDTCRLHRNTRRMSEDMAKVLIL